MKDFITKYKFFIGVLGVISIFILIFTLNTSDSKNAISEIKKASSQEMVLNSWNKWIEEINSNNGKEKLIKATKDKLAKMDLSDKEIAEWHNRFRKYSDNKPSLNIIIIPDLSLRINQIPNTAKNDKEIISEIYNIFFNNARHHKSTDRLILEVTDNNQVSGIFGQIATNLSIDMTDKGNNTNSINYLKDKEETFKANLDKLYMEAERNTSGADYFYYFKRILPNRIKKSDIYNEYQNKIIILTDGYLETSDKIYTQVEGAVAPILKTAVDNGTLSEVMEDRNLRIPSVGYKLPNTEIIVLEIKERSNGIMWHREVLDRYWKNWFIDMGVEKNIIRSQDVNINETKRFIKSKFSDIKN